MVQWREAHWSLRLRLQEVVQNRAYRDIERLYDAARRADNLLTEFYQLRAEHLARRLRAVLMTTVSGAERHATDRDTVDDEERALLGHFRALAAEDRTSLLRLASRLGDEAAHHPTTRPGRPTA